MPPCLAHQLARDLFLKKRKSLRWDNEEHGKARRERTFSVAEFPFSPLSDRNRFGIWRLRTLERWWSIEWVRFLLTNKIGEGNSRNSQTVDDSWTINHLRCLNLELNFSCQTFLQSQRWSESIQPICWQLMSGCYSLLLRPHPHTQEAFDTISLLSGSFVFLFLKHENTQKMLLARLFSLNLV